MPVPDGVRHGVRGAVVSRVIVNGMGRPRRFADEADSDDFMDGGEDVNIALDASDDDDSDSSSPEEIGQNVVREAAREQRAQERASHRQMRQARIDRVRQLTARIHASADEKRRAALSEHLPRQALDLLESQQSANDDVDADEDMASVPVPVERRPAPTRVTVDGFQLQLLSATKASVSAHAAALEAYKNAMNGHRRAFPRCVGRPAAKFATLSARPVPEFVRRRRGERSE
ncbi:unnamed protein product (mitochondrion) [Plasmodiophora brassicae]|uniref:Uncharacterized protein n=2 Tax=Plasmodiophora brassicae TaxID=37360 RepID=A0A3P3YL30_PLABS|nr:unnamed protein product [Plasmodiophora brassicae]